MTTEMLLTNDQPLRFKIIRPVYEVLTVNDNAAKHFEPLEAIAKSKQLQLQFREFSLPTHGPSQRHFSSLVQQLIVQEI